MRASNRLDRHRRPALTFAKPGRYTDDTQMTIAVTEALMSGAAWSADYEDDLPAVLLDGLEAGAYGRAFLEDLDRQLVALVR